MYTKNITLCKVKTLIAMLLIALMLAIVKPVFSKGIAGPSSVSDTQTIEAEKRQEVRSNTQNNTQQAPAAVEPQRRDSVNIIERRDAPADQNRNQRAAPVQPRTETRQPQPRTKTETIIIDRGSNDRSGTPSNRENPFNYGQPPKTKSNTGWIPPADVNKVRSSENNRNRNNENNRIREIEKSINRERVNDNNASNYKIKDPRDANSNMPRLRSETNFINSMPTTNKLPDGFRLPDDPRREYRKDYEDVGNIWRQRYNRRNYHEDNRNKTNVNIFINNFNYPHYCYDYRPLYSYPSMYCYYYDYYPPYIYGSRIFFFEPFSRIRNFSEITIFMNYTDNFYYTDPFRISLNTTLRDIERAWMEKDIDRFSQYIQPRSYIAIFMKGNYNYSLDWLDYMDMTRDAMINIDTRGFRFDKVVRRQQTGEVVAYAIHKFYDYNNSIETMYLSYTFERIDGNWYITETGTSTYKNW